MVMWPAAFVAAASAVSHVIAGAGGIGVQHSLEAFFSDISAVSFPAPISEPVVKNSDPTTTRLHTTHTLDSSRPARVDQPKLV